MNEYPSHVELLEPSLPLAAGTRGGGLSYLTLAFIRTMDVQRPRHKGGFVIIAAVAVALSAFTAGCAETHGEGNRDPDRPLFDGAAVIVAEEERTIGGPDDGPPEFVFGRIADLAFDENGDVLVLDALAHEVRRFDGEGAFRGRIGGPGEGPGELSGPRMVHASPGRVTVLDQNGRVVSYAPDGTPIGEERTPVWSMQRVLAFLSSSPEGGAPDAGRDRLLGFIPGSAGMQGTPAGVAIVTIGAGDVVDTVSTGSSGTIFYRSPTASMALISPVCDGLHAGAVSPDAFFVADGASGRVTRFRWMDDGFDEGDAWSVALPGDPPSDDRISELRARIPEPLVHPDGELFAPEIDSPICDLRAGTDGRIWIRLQDPDPGELWGVFDPSVDGAAGAATVRFPPADRVFAFGRDRAAAVTRDDLGVESVRIWRFDR